MSPFDERGQEDIDTVFATLRHSLNQLTDHGSQLCMDCLEHRRIGMAAVDYLEAMSLGKHTQHSIPSVGDVRAATAEDIRKRVAYMRTDSGKWRRIFDANRRPDSSYFYVVKGFPVRVPWLLWVMGAPLGESVDYK